LIESLERGHDFQSKDWWREWIKLTNDWKRSRGEMIEEDL
jgi:alpha-N-acetylglucosaminidase